MNNWRANTDASAVTSALAIVWYIAKYVVKAEPNSDAFNLINQNVINRMNQNDTLRNYIYKSICDYVSMRDFSVNEICHYLMGYDVCSSSHKFVYINLQNKTHALYNHDDLGRSVDMHVHMAGVSFLKKSYRKKFHTLIFVDFFWYRKLRRRAVSQSLA